MRSSSNIYNTFKPIIIINQFLGYQTASNSTKPSQYLYSVIIFILYIIGTYFYFQYAGNDSFLLTDNFLVRIGIWFQLYGLNANMYISLTLQIWHRHEIRNCLERFRRIDVMMYRQPDCEIKSRYKRDVHQQTRIVRILLIVFGLINTLSICVEGLELGSDVVEFMVMTSVNFILTFHYGYPALQYSSFLICAKFRYKFINSLLTTKYLKSTNETAVKRMYLNKIRKPIRKSFHTRLLIIPEQEVEFDHRQFIDDIFEIHYLLYESCKFIDIVYGAQILTFFSINFFIILASLHYLSPFSTNGHGRQYADLTLLVMYALRLIWTLIAIYGTISLTSSASSVANLTKKILHRIRNQHDYIKSLTDFYSLQLLHHDLQFTACGFFTIDFNLAFSTIGAITTYLIIFIQFDVNGQDMLENYNITEFQGK